MFRNEDTRPILLTGEGTGCGRTPTRHPAVFSLVDRSYAEHMIARIGLLISATIGRWIPEPFILALGLTVVTAIIALLFGFPPQPVGASGNLVEISRGDAAGKLLESWWNPGLWKFLGFSMQMSLILVTGFAVAQSRPVRWLINAFSSIPRDTAGAAALVGLVAMTTGLVNWGLGLIVGALLAYETARSLSRRGIRAHYPLICAAGYTGLLVWHGGLSGSAPTKMSKPDQAADILPASVIETIEGGAIPLQQTLFSGLNLFVSLGLLVVVPITLFLLAPRKQDEIRTADELDVEHVDPDGDETKEQDGRSSIIAIVINLGVAIALLTGMVLYLSDSKRGFGAIGPDEINATMLGIGMLLHVSPTSYLRAVETAVRGCAGIIIQFPLYAGIMMMMSVSGLMRMASEFAAEHAGPNTLPLLTFLSAGVVNFFVPSGGGQWGVQGPIALEAGAAAGVSASEMIMSVAYGDQLTNMLQPFWALPLLAITGIKARDIVGYTAIVMVVAGLWMALGLWVF
jgi:short-chain fatty acids transporter